MFEPRVPPEAVERGGAVRRREIDAAVQHNQEVDEACEGRRAARGGRTSTIRTALRKFLRR